MEILQVASKKVTGSKIPVESMTPVSRKEALS
jgi:hypothetical protein